MDLDPRDPLFTVPDFLPECYDEVYNLGVETARMLRDGSWLYSEDEQRSNVTEVLACFGSLGLRLPAELMAWANDVLDGTNGDHPLLHSEFESRKQADVAVRSREYEQARQMRTVVSGHGANGSTLVLVCDAGCDYASVHYVVRLQKSTRWKVVEAVSRHRNCIARLRTNSRVLANSDVITGAVISSKHLPSSLRALQTLAVSQGVGFKPTKATMSRVRANILREHNAKADATTAFLPEYVRKCVQLNVGSYAKVVLHQVIAGAEERRILRYENVGGNLATSDSHEDTPITGAQLAQLLFVPGTSACLLQASVPVISIDYGRRLFERGGGNVVIVAECGEVLVPLAINHCEVETAADWADTVAALCRVSGDYVTKRAITVIGDRFSGADEALEDAMPDSWNRVYCKFHLLLNLNDPKVVPGAGRIKNESLFWRLVDSPNNEAFEVNMAAFEEAYPQHAAYLNTIPKSKWVFCHAAARGVFVGRVQASRAELEFARGKRDSSRMARGVDVLSSFLRKHASLLDSIKLKVGALHGAARLLMPKAQIALNEALSKSVYWAADNSILRRSLTGRPEQGHVRLLDAEEGTFTLVDTVGPVHLNFRPDLAMHLELGDTGMTGYCERCHQPDGRGEVCEHLIRFVLDAQRPAAAEQDNVLCGMFHRAYRVPAIHGILATARAVVVPSYDDIEREGHEIAPLVGTRGPGRPRTQHGKRGPKPKARILSNGEVEMRESRKEARLTEKV